MRVILLELMTIVVGLLHYKYYVEKIRLKSSSKIIKGHTKTGNYIISEIKAGYDWLISPYSGYIHSKNNHGNGDF